MRPPTVAFMTTSGHAGSDGTAPGNEPANHAGENANIHIDPVAFPAPVNYFASDNAAGAHPDAIDAIVAANVGPALAYGHDRHTEAATARIRDLVRTDASVLFVYGGTGANVVALGSLALPHEAVICPATAHIHVDECGAPERIAGTKLFPVPTEDGKLRPADIERFVPFIDDPHHPQPKVVSISQTTEEGTLYSKSEIAELAATAHAHDMYLFVDGARLANGAAALGLDLHEFTTDIGVDAFVLGGTKAGLVFGEAVVFLNPTLATRAEFVRKASAQLASKQRFVAAQFDALLAGGAWIEGARNANAMARELAQRLASVVGVDIGGEPHANAVFASIPTPAIQPLIDWSPFWVWDPGPAGASHQLVRWMTSWATTTEDVDRFVAGIAHALDQVSV